MKPFVSTILHVLELAAVLAAVYFMKQYFNLQAFETQALIACAIAAVIKFARVSDKVPLNDYVNPKK